MGDWDGGDYDSLYYLHSYETTAISSIPAQPTVVEMITGLCLFTVREASKGFLISLRASNLYRAT